MYLYHSPIWLQGCEQIALGWYCDGMVLSPDLALRLKYRKDYRSHLQKARALLHGHGKGAAGRWTDLS